jgi:hypothetical protein
MLQKRNEKSNQLMVGDTVVIANRFFQNHQIIKREYGFGRVIQLDKEVPYIWVEFSRSTDFIYYMNRGWLTVVEPNNDISDNRKMRVKFHPVYLEKVETKHAKKKQK